MSSPPLAESGEAPRVLVIDHETDTRDLVLSNIRNMGFVADGASSGLEGLSAARALRPAVIVLDLMLPDMLGTAVCSAIRHDAALAGVGILMLTARTSDYDRIQGLEAGADDYVAKPFNERELVVRVRALARRAADSHAAREASVRASVYRWRGIEVEVNRHRVTLDGEPVTLRPLEFKLLSTLLAAPGTLFSRGDLLRLVWGIEDDNDSRTVDTHVRRLRERVAPYGAALETVHRLGYRWRDAAAGR